MHPFLRVPAAVATLLIIPPSRIEAQSVRAPAAPQTAAKPSEAAAPAEKPDDQPPVPSAAPQAPAQRPEVAASAEKQADKTAGKSDGGKQEQKDAGDGKPVDEPSLASILPKILLNADADGDGQMSRQEFRQMPPMKELKPERIDSLFAGIDADVNAALSSQELTKGFSLLAQLAKEGRSLLDEKGLLSQAKELTRQVQKTTGISPKPFLLKLIQNADKNGNGGLSADEFRQLPLLIDLKKERVDSLFGDIDADSDASLTPEEIGNGFGSITSLAREGKSLLDDEDAARLKKKLKPRAP